MIAWADFVEAVGQIIPKALRRLAANIFFAGACAPLMPSGWLWLTAALASASRRTSSTLLKAQATGLTRIAEPLPKLL